MKKVLIIGPTEFRGGIESFVEQLLKQLHGEFSFYILQFRSKPIVDSDKLRIKYGVRIVRVLIPTGIRGKFKQKKIAINFLTDNHFDLVHINTNSPASYFWAEAAIKSGSKVIYHSHNSQAETQSRLGKPILAVLRHYQKYRLSRLNIKRIQVSDVAGKWMYGNKENSQIMVNGFDVSSYTFSDVVRQEFRKKLEIKNSDKVLLVASRMVEQKNIFRSLSIIVKAINTGIIDYAFFIGEGDLSNKLDNQINALPKSLRDKIKFLGVQKDVSPWYSFSDILLMPSLYEGLPYSAVEAQANGLPILMSNTITNQVKLSNIVYSLSLKVDDEQWEHKISEIVQQKNKRQQYNKIIYNTDYNILTFKRRFLNLYKEVLNIDNDFSSNDDL